MAALADLFSPTFLMFLGILVLVVALLVVYFESKMRDQNHKIASMLSLVSTLAEDMNGVKMGLNQLAEFNRIIGGNVPQNFVQQTPLENSRVPFKQETKLIEVSDGEDDEEEDDEDDEEIDDEEIDDEEIEDEIDDEDDDDDNDNNDVVKVLKIDMNLENDSENLSEDNNLELDVDELDDELSEVQSLSSKSSKISDKLEETLHEDKMPESFNISSSDLKTISINLEDPNPNSQDYKKLSLPKLRSIAFEKGLVPDASKLKKNELLKLLGAE